MTINSVKYVGPDQAWAREVERELTEMKQTLAFLVQQIDNINRRINNT